MQPKTILQKRVIELSKKLTHISHKQAEWGINKCFEYTGYLRKKSIWCLECGHVFKSDEGDLSVSVLGIDCPECGKHIKVIQSDKRMYRRSEYYSIHTVKDEFQVLRHFVIEKSCYPNKQANISVIEAVQNWIAPDGKVINVARSAIPGIYYDLWDFNSDLEIRCNPAVPQKYDVFNEIYPVRRYTDMIKRNGFKNSFHDISPVKLLPIILKSSYAETLIKTNQFDLLKMMVYANHKNIHEYWDSIKICIRNNYIIHDAAIWTDYIKLLEHFGRDLRNKKYICPVNLKAEHDRYVEKRAEQRRREEAEKKKLQLEADTRQFLLMKSRFFGCEFSDDLIKVKVLDSLKEYVQEGEKLKHCVFASDYHLKKDSIILSARINNEPVETIEVSLKNYNILQCRGKRNQNSEYHERIIQLVEQNTHLIRKRSTVRKTSKKTA